ncbi:MAG: class I SAM-dependent methyltransferase [Polyangiaceae bacterium]|nr:class I SAM-dependent methyltransferase [Polyangiaceae bacterium]
MDSLYAHPLLYSQLHDHRIHDLPFYLGWARTARGGILDLGAGTGRVALHLARAGHHVVAVERDRTMLALFETRLAREPDAVRARVTSVACDVAELALGRRFALSLCAFNGIAHQQSPAELRGFLDRVAAHLTPNGWFVFDSWLPNPHLLAGAAGYVPWFRHPRDDRPCRATESTRYDPGTEVLEITMEVASLDREAPPERTRLALKQREPPRLRAELEALGWVVHGCDIVGEDAFFSCRRAAAPRILR